MTKEPKKSQKNDDLPDEKFLGSSDSIKSKILLVESLHSARNKISAILKHCQLDQELEIQTDGREAVKSLMAAPDDYHLIICDSHVFGLNGYGLLNFVKNSPRHNNIPFMMLSESDEFVKAKNEKATAGGADAFMSKPVNADKFSQTVHYLLDVHRVRKSPRNFIVSALPGSSVNDFVKQISQLNMGSIEVVSEESDIAQVMASGPSSMKSWEMMDRPGKPEWSLWVEFLVGATRSVENLTKRWKQMRADVRYHSLPFLILHNKGSSIVKQFRSEILGDRLLETFVWPCDDVQLAAVISSLMREHDSSRKDSVQEMNHALLMIKSEHFEEAENSLRSLHVIPDEVMYRVLISKCLIGTNRLAECMVELEMGLDSLKSIWESRKEDAKNWGSEAGQDTINFLKSHEIQSLLWLVEQVMKVAVELNWHTRAEEAFDLAENIIPDHSQLLKLKKRYEVMKSHVMA